MEQLIIYGGKAIETKICFELVVKSGGFGRFNNNNRELILDIYI